MTSRLPAGARSILEAGVLCYVAVRVPGQPGPHLTPVVYAEDGGALWVTTARHSVKAAAFRREGRAAGMVQVGSQAVTFRARVRTYDALDPLSWPAATVRGPRILRATARFSLKNARFFAGYAVDANRVPFAWSPPGRVFVELRLESGRVLDFGQVVSGWGPWPEGVAFRSTFAALPEAALLDERLPDAVREALGRRGRGALALDAEGRLTVLPVRWLRDESSGTYAAVAPRELLELAANAEGTAAAALTIDRASRWRAADMTGALLQGAAQVFAPEETARGRRALVALLARVGVSLDEGPWGVVRLRPQRAVWWRGWTSGTVRAGPAPAGRGRRSARSGVKLP